jgi:2-dehydro-3-deoxyglucarate aldolase/4-hydroxy-2-oxoheptanedioate aldolase
MEGSFATRLRNRESLVGAWSIIGNPTVAEHLAHADFDFVVFDGEHSENTIEDMGVGIRAVEAADAGTVPIVRVSENNGAEIRRLLDLDPRGIVVPQIESLDEAEAAVDATQYPPEGVRGVAGSRASEYGRSLGEYLDSANESIATILQIETGGALEDVEEIAAIDGLDGLFIGPADLSARLGVFGQFESEQFLDAVERTVAAAAEHDVAVGTLATGLDAVERRQEWGVDFIATGTDVGYLREAADQYLDRYHETRE